MNSILKNILAISVGLASLTANADDKGRLFIIGEATPAGWDLDMSQAILSTTEAPSVYRGTIYLKAGENKTFKFMQSHEWGSTEFGLATDASQSDVSGNIKLATGTFDDGYKQLQVAKDGNYDIVIDTESLEGDIVLSAYQTTEIIYSSIYLVGNATNGGWSIEDGTPLYQNTTSPFEYKAVVSLKSTDNGNPASFKIATALRGAGSWNPKYFLFKDADDAGKISTDSTDDRQWSVKEGGTYTVTVNTLSNTISIEKTTGDASGIESIISSATDNEPAVYYNLQGQRVNTPSNGIFIEVIGNKARKVKL